MKIQAYIFPNLVDEAEEFFLNYGIEKFVICPSGEVKNFKPKEERVCRFCGLDYSQTTFNSKPHIISELLGNKYLISDFECDKCNKFFGDSYENDLTSFLGISRTFSGIKNKKNKIPIFNSLGYKVLAKRTNFYGIKNGLKISIPKLEKGIFNIEDKAGKAEIIYLKQPYSPINLYKSLLKIALSIIPEKYVAEYKYVFQNLKENNNAFSKVAKMVYYELPYHHSAANPVCFLFKKLEVNTRVPNHVFALYYQNNIFQFPIPFCKVDIDNNLYDGRSNSVPLCPPILFLKPNAEAKYYRGIKDLSSNERKREKEVITFLFEPNIMSSMKAYDDKTGEATTTAFDPDAIAEIYIAPYDSRLSLFNHLDLSGKSANLFD